MKKIQTIKNLLKALYIKSFAASVLLFFFFLFFPVTVSAQGKKALSHPDSAINKLGRYIPAGDQLTLFLVLPPHGEKAKNIKEFSNGLYETLLPFISSPTHSAPGKKFGQEFFPEKITAAYTGDDKNGVLLLDLAMPEKKFLQLLRKHVKNIVARREKNMVLYSGQVSPRDRKGFLFTFIAPDIMVLTENTPQKRAHFYRYLTAKKGLSAEMKSILAKRRKKAFIYGGAKMEAVQNSISTFLPAAQTLQHGGFDILFTKDNSLSIAVFFDSGTMENAQMLAMMLNNYKMLLAGLLASASDPAKPIDPNRLIQIRQNGKNIHLYLLLQPELIPVLQNMFHSGFPAGQKMNTY